MKNIVIFYTPGAYGSFLSWMIERFNTARQAHEPKVIDNPLQVDGSSHGYATLCKCSCTAQVEQWLTQKETTPWGYRIWAGWPVTSTASLDQAIEQTLTAMGANDYLIVVSRTTEWETKLCWLNAQTKLDRDRWFKDLGISHESELGDKFKQELEQRHFNRLADSRLLEISVNEILFAPTQRVLSLVTQLGLTVCDAELFDQILTENRLRQYNIEKING